MPVNQDLSDLFKILFEEKVEYLIIGAHAVSFYTQPRYTKDIDILVNPTKENASRVWRALERFGAPLQDISLSDFQDEELVYQIGIEPNRIDILMGIPSVIFPEAWKNRIESRYTEIPINIIGKQDLIKTKKAVDRPQDRLDIQRLEE
jgi:hypothetical protein